MPSAWVVGPLVIQSTLAVLITSLLFGVVIYFLFGQVSYLEKKRNVDDFTTILVIFILSLWIAKFITNASLALKFPMAVLVYPADRWAFYLGLVLAFIYIRFIFMKKRDKMNELMITMFIILMSAQFIYKFIYYVLERTPQLIWGMILYGLLLSLSIMWQHKQSNMILGCLIIILGLGNLIQTIFTRVTFFHFYTDWPFWLIVLIIGAVYIILDKRVKKITK